MSACVVPCAYCGVRRGHTKDHVVPQSWRKRWKREREWMKRRMPKAEGYQALVDIPAELLETVPCCLECNVRRGTRKLVPPSWEDRIPALKALIPGQWRVWHGNIREASFRETFV